MLSIFIETLAPLTSIFLFALGTGFCATFLAVVMTTHDASHLTVGALTGLHYAGLVLGTLRSERFIVRIGHIRAYIVFSVLLAFIYLLHGIIYSPGFWLFLRFIAGLLTAGLWVVIESWLLCKSSPKTRGRILSLYMIMYYSAQGLGQFLLNLSTYKSIFLFALTSILCLLSIIPLILSRRSSPQYNVPSTLRLRNLIQQATAGFCGCLSSGILLGSIYGLMPMFLTVFTPDPAQTATCMFVIIAGGVVLQYPMGKLSDLVPRRWILLLIVLATILVSITLSFIHVYSWLFLLLMALLGGFTFTLYPISIAYACDSLEPKDLVAGTQSLLLSYSVGAAIGPFIAPFFMEQLGMYGIFIYFIFICSLSIPFIMRTPRSPQTEMPWASHGT